MLHWGPEQSTKCYDRQRHIVSRVENVKSVTDYISRIDEMLQQKQEHGTGGLELEEDYLGTACDGKHFPKQSDERVSLY